MSSSSSSSSFSRALLRGLRNWLLPRAPKVRKIRFGIARGARMKIDFRYHTAVYFGVYETELNPHFRRLVTPGSRCFDVGGNIGYDAIVLAKLSERGPVVCFESNEANLPLMRENFACNPYDLRIVHGYVSRPGQRGATTLDEAAERHFVPDFIKMDIEGAEADALLGARRILSERKPALVIEAHGEQRERECLAILRGYGYEPRVVTPRRGWLKEFKGDMRITWLVCEGAPARSAPPRVASVRREPAMAGSAARRVGARGEIV
jgi:Methyltransferase FkbM domain